MRIEAARRKITMIEVRDRRLMLTQRRELLQKDGRFPRLTGVQPRLYVAPDFIEHRNDSLPMIRAVVFLALIFALAGKALTQRVEVIDGIAAIVNNDVVTISQVRDLIGARERSLTRDLQRR